MGIALIVLAVALTLTNAPPRVVRVNAPTGANGELATLVESGELCQSHEVLPAGVSALRLSIGAYLGSPIRVTVSSGSHIVTQGRRGADWTGTSATVPVTPVSHTVTDAKLCIDLAPVSELAFIQGAASSSGESAAIGGGRPLGGKVLVEDLAAGHGSWWSRIGSLASHMALGRAFTGAWVVWLIAILMAVVGVLAVRLPLLELRSRAAPTRRLGRRIGRIPRAAWICALIAFLNASAWSLIVPPFQGKDEADHFAYVETLAENNTLPENGQENGIYSAQESLVLQASRYFQMTHAPQGHAIFTQAEQRALSSAVHAGQSLRTSGEAGIATAEPPLYYALQTIPYEVARGNIIAELQLMRLVGSGSVCPARSSYPFLRGTRERWLR